MLIRFKAPVLPQILSSCQVKKIGISHIIVHSGQTPLPQQEDRSGSNSGVGTSQKLCPLLNKPLPEKKHAFLYRKVYP